MHVVEDGNGALRCSMQLVNKEVDLLGNCFIAKAEDAKVPRAKKIRQSGLHWILEAKPVEQSRNCSGKMLNNCMECSVQGLYLWAILLKLSEPFLCRQHVSPVLARGAIPACKALQPSQLLVSLQMLIFLDTAFDMTSTNSSLYEK